MKHSKVGVVIVMVSLLTLQSNVDAQHKRGVKRQQEESFWNTYGHVFTHGIPWIVALVGTLYYRSIAQTKGMQEARNICHYLGNGFSATVVPEGQEEGIVVKLTESGAKRLCRDFVKNFYQDYCEKEGYTIFPVLKFN